MPDYVHSYCNCRPAVDWNTCGQAAIATVEDYWGIDRYNLPRIKLDTRDGRMYWDDGTVIDRIIADGFGPDVALGLGTTGGGIVDALRAAAGMRNAAVAWSGIFSSGWEDRWRELRDYVALDRIVPVCVDVGALGGAWYTAHWAIAYKIDDVHVYLGNMHPDWNSTPTTDLFLHAWHCWYLPAGFNHCGVYAYP